MANTTSVLIAEAAALALAASVVSGLDIQSPVILTDNQKPVTFFNGDDQALHPELHQRQLQ